MERARAGPRAEEERKADKGHLAAGQLAAERLV